MVRKSQPRSIPMQSKLFKEALAISIMFVSFMLLLMLLSYNPTDTSNFYAAGDTTFLNLAGRLGAMISVSLYYWFGYIAFIGPLFLFIYSWGILSTARHPMHIKLIKRLSGIMLLLSLCGLLSFHSEAATELPATLGGYTGIIIASQSHSLLGIWGANLFLLLLVIVSTSLFSGLSWLGIFEVVGGVVMLLFSKLQFNKAKGLMNIPLVPAKNLLDVLTKGPKTATNKSNSVEPKFVFMPGQSELAGKLEESDKMRMPQGEYKTEQRELQTTESPQIIPDRQSPSSASPASTQKNIPVGKPTSTPTANPTAATDAAPAAVAAPATSASSAPAISKRTGMQTGIEGYQLPTTDLLTPPAPQDSGLDDATLSNLGETLVSTLKDFGISVKLLGYSPGPVVTMFEVEPAAGIKSSRISNLANDLSRSLAVGNVRVVEFISGKSCIGVEVPNPKRQIVNFRQLLESSEFSDSSLRLPLALGQDIGGTSVVADMAAMPHLLVAGTTGSGKSIGINSMLISLLYKYSPQQLRLILVDPKMLELASYNDIPNMLTPVITDMTLAAKSIGWCVIEMDRRYKLMAGSGVRNIESYNEQLASKKVPSEPTPDESTPPEQPLPYIVIVIDEYADMIMVNRKVEDHIVRLAQKARASGIHICLATQRPSVDVITGLIKANVPARISFKVSSRIDSRTVLDQSGAEQLLGKGDMLYMGSGGDPARRVHGAFVTDEDIQKVTDHCRQQGTPEYHHEVFTAPAAGEKPTAAAGGEEEKDELYAEAVEFIRESERVSISLVQRKFKIGYNRAARIIEFMEEDGVVSSMDNAGKRTILS
ncbi:MAG: DNA translocase FtsK 4TM domain-containing protein [Gammaproteobacteria bacterium]|nr:DNA translocase FtsK 4TM domain-containing protein [Gammaproteobacteria bacterium]